ncbi:LYR motif containing protein 1-like [Montipora foliosa]|uniref:LYR motif containing protein 1-like n=1 Tax=Montipora foliosa TaxID=591990 RepID=UPI0035F20DD9
MFRRDVLSLYRRILRISQKWEAVMPADTENERHYIREEARKLFQRNKAITNPEEVKLHIHEANSRIDMALHYRSPYPRLMHMPPSAVPKTSKRQRKTQDRIRKQAKPVYMLSDEDVDK